MGSGDGLIAGMGMQTLLPPVTFQKKSAFQNSVMHEESLAPLSSLVSGDLFSPSLPHVLTAPTSKLPSHLQEHGLGFPPVLHPLCSG